MDIKFLSGLVIPNFLEGLARNLDFAGSIENGVLHERGDAASLRSDWDAVQSDYCESIKQIGEERNGDKEVNQK